MSDEVVLSAKISNQLSKSVKLLLILYSAVVLLFIILGFIVGSGESSYHTYSGWFGLVFVRHGTGIGSGADSDYYIGGIIGFVFIVLIFIALPVIYYLISNRARKLTELSVSEKEVIGSYTAFIPVSKITLRMPIEKIDNVSAVKSIFFIFTGKMVRIGSTSSVIRIPYVLNADEVVSCILNMIEQTKQANKISVAPQAEAYNKDYADSIRKLAELRDAGIISEEEFNKKKSELLNKI